MDFRLKVEEYLSNINLHGVSILVLMDFRLKEREPDGMAITGTSFNPCSNGLSAQRFSRSILVRSTGWVSILVLMDFRLKAAMQGRKRVTFGSFNPCSNGLSAQRLEEARTLEQAIRFQSLF